MIPVYSSWLAAHGNLWYDDNWYRFAWLVWPQGLAAALVLLFWAMPSTVKTVPWAEPIDPRTRAQQLQALRNTAESNRAATETLGRDARSGEMLAQFYYATLFDPQVEHARAAVYRQGNRLVQQSRRPRRSERTEQSHERLRGR